MNTAQVTPLIYRYDFDQLDRVPEGMLSARVTPRKYLSGDSATTGKSLSIGAVVAGKSMQVSLVHNARGTGSKLHSHPNEQFNYVLKGTLIADIDGQVFRIPVGHMIHIPAGVVHSHVSTEKEDVLFVAAKDTRHGIVGPPVDGRHDGPRTLPGFGTHSGNDWKVGADGLPEAQSPRTSAKLVRYLYETARMLEHASDGIWSGKLMPRADLASMLLAPAATVSGEKLTVGMVRLAHCHEPAVRRCDVEQFFMVIEGELCAEVDGQSLRAPPHSGIHIPAGVPHILSASSRGGAFGMLVEANSAADS